MHIITSLGSGGAEKLLMKLIQETSTENVEHSVVCLIPPQDTTLSSCLKNMGVDIKYLSMSNVISNITSLLKLLNILRRSDCDCIHTWMYHANLIGGFVNILSLRVPLVWSIHHLSDNKAHLDNRITRIISSVSAYLSHMLPVRIVYCSELAKENHEKSGYNKNISAVIDNGIDVELFRPNQMHKLSLRAELSLDKNTVLIGLIARYHRIKGHDIFIKAASIVTNNKYDVKFLLCGEGCEIYNIQLKNTLVKHAMLEHFYLLGERRDISRITAALDIATSASYSESFSLTVAEAMSSGVICVVTESGGADYLLGPNGWSVPVGNPQSLADAWVKIINLSSKERIELQENYRKRIIDRFSMKSMITSYLSLYKSIIN